MDTSECRLDSKSGHSHSKNYILFLPNFFSTSRVGRLPFVCRKKVASGCWLWAARLPSNSVYIYLSLLLSTQVSVCSFILSYLNHNTHYSISKKIVSFRCKHFWKPLCVKKRYQIAIGEKCCLLFLILLNFNCIRLSMIFSALYYILTKKRR